MFAATTGSRQREEESSGHVHLNETIEMSETALFMLKRYDVFFRFNSTFVDLCVVAHTSSLLENFF